MSSHIQLGFTFGDQRDMDLWFGWLVCWGWCCQTMFPYEWYHVLEKILGKIVILMEFLVSTTFLLSSFNVLMLLSPTKTCIKWNKIFLTNRKTWLRLSSVPKNKAFFFVSKEWFKTDIWYNCNLLKICALPVDGAIWHTFTEGCSILLSVLEYSINLRGQSLLCNSVPI